MQNSIWKLTALAGVIGVGFLIVLQAQSSLDRDPNTVAQAEGRGDGSETVAPASSNDDANDRLWSPESSDSPEPGRLKTSPQTSSDLLLAGNSEPVSEPGFEPDAAVSSATGGRPKLFDSSRFAEPSDSAEIGSQPPTLRPIGNRLFAERPQGFEAGQPFPERAASQSPQPAFGEDPFGSDATSEATPTAGAVGTLQPLPDADFQPQETDKAKAARLMAEARKAKDLGDLETARTQLLEAIELPVVFGPLDERPQTLLAEIDALLKSKANSPPAQVENATIELLPTLPEFADDSVPKPASNVAENPVDASPELREKTSSQSTQPATLPFAENSTGDRPAFGDEPALKSAGTAGPSKTRSELPSLLPVPASNSTVEEGTAAASPSRTNSAARSATQVEPRPELAIEKIAPSDATLGKPMIYAIVIENRGPSNAAQVTVEDQVPKGCELVGTIPQAELVGSKLVWPIGRLPAGQKKKIQIKVVPTEEGEIGSVASVSFVAEPAADEQRKPVAETQLKSAAPKLLLNVVAPPEAQLGESVVLKFKLTNAGQKDAEDVNLQSIIPAGFEHSDGNDLTYPVGKLAPGKSLEVELQLKAVKPGEQINRTIVTALGGVQVESTTPVQVSDPRGLRVETPDTPRASVGQPSVQEFRLINESSREITSVQITASLPDQLRFVKASSAGEFNSVKNQVRWTVARIPSGETAVISLTSLPKVQGNYTVVIDVAQPGQPVDRQESRLTARGVSALAVSLDHAQSAVLPGDEFTVDVTIRNKGDGPDGNVSLLLHLPPELEFVQAKAPVRNLQPQAGTSKGKRVPFTAIPEIGEKASVDFEITLRAKSAGKAKVRAEISSDGLDEPIASEAVIAILETNP